MENKPRKCPRCGNTEPAWFYHGTRGWYCRRCIAFGRIMLEEDVEAVQLREIRSDADAYTLRYPLTPAQKEIGRRAAAVCREKDVLIQAVCGAGKTEMVLPAIAQTLREKKRVGFAVARRQVVLELADRLSGIFRKASVTAVCGGHTSITDGDLIVCTTHQLYRYLKVFHLLILDEPDAFPFRGDPVLHGIAAASCIGHIIYLTATPDAELKKRIARGNLFLMTLNERPHGHPLPVPVLKTGPFLLLIFWLLAWLRRCRNHPRMVFVPTIARAHLMAEVLRIFEPQCLVLTSRSENRDAVIERFRRQRRGLIVTTTVLERGVTVPGVDVCVFEAEHRVFDEAGLVQMAGRAGRSFRCPEGSVLFLLKSRSDAAESCVRQLEAANEQAMSVVRKGT